MPSATPRLNELARKAGSALLAAWVVWWAESLWRLSLRGASYTWDRVPFFGADFTTETDHAARLWLSGVDPYVSREWLFHYPPLVIRLFSWVTFFDSETALRIWIVALIALLGLVALRRWRALAGFVVAGVAIGLAAPAETVRSFESLAVAVERIKTLCALDAAHPWETYHPWTHSLSVAWIKANHPHSRRSASR